MKIKTMIDKLWSVQWIWAKSHLSKLKNDNVYDHLSVWCWLIVSVLFYFPPLFLLAYMTSTWSSIEEFEEWAYNRWILWLRWTIIIIIHGITQCIKPHQLALEKRDIHQKVSTSLWRLLSRWLRKMRDIEWKGKILNNDNCEFARAHWWCKI